MKGRSKKEEGKEGGAAWEGGMIVRGVETVAVRARGGEAVKEQLSSRVSIPELKEKKSIRSHQSHRSSASQQLLKLKPRRPL